MPTGKTEQILGAIIVDGNIIQLVRIFAPFGVDAAGRISVILTPMSRWISARQGFRLILGLAISLSPFASATPVFGQTSDADFAACTVRLKQEAQTAGISAEVAGSPIPPGGSLLLTM